MIASIHELRSKLQAAGFTGPAKRLRDLCRGLHNSRMDGDWTIPVPKDIYGHLCYTERDRIMAILDHDAKQYSTLLDSEEKRMG